LPHKDVMATQHRHPTPLSPWIWWVRQDYH